MELCLKPFDVQEISFTTSLVDRVHVESLCRLLRRNTDEVDMASHATDHGKLVMRVRMKCPGVDARQCIKKAAESRWHELDAMSKLFQSA